MRKDLRFDEYPFIVPNQKKVVEKLNGFLTDLKKCEDFASADKVFKKYCAYSEKLATQTSVIMVKYTIDTTNKKYKNAQDKVDELSPIMSNVSNEIAKVLVSASYRPEMEKKYGTYLFTMYENALKSFDEKIIDDLIEENKLTSKHDEIIGGAQIEFRGEMLNLSQLAKYTQDKDRNTRREAAIATDKWWGEHEQEIGEIYSQLVLLRDKMAKTLGFENFIPLGYLRLGRTDYDAKKAEVYRNQITEVVVPVCQKLYRDQMKKLGIRKPQYYDYNLKFASGNPLPAGDKDYLVGCAKTMYTNLSKESEEFFNFMVDHNLMDLEARKGKAPGGYCTSFPSYKAPFIFSNFNGTSGDVDVLTHEGGHAFQGYLCRNMKVAEYQNPTLEACEIHSMSMEFFAWPYAPFFFKEEAEKYRFVHLSDAIEFLPYGITVDEFQHWVYEHPTATHEERCAIWREIEKRNLPHKKYDELPTFNHGGWWMKQSHIFQTPFYYIDYTLAQVVAFQFLAEDRKNHEKAWKKYVKYTKMGGKYPFLTLLEKAHLRNPFEDGNVKKAIKPLLKILKEIDSSKF